MRANFAFLVIFHTLLGYCNFGQAAEVSLEEVEDQGRYTIEGRVYPPELFPDTESQWQKDTVISINGGESLGFLREDGSFIISGVPSGSYVLEIVNADYIYESVRVEINPKGKFRARKVNFVQPAQVIQVPYPLKLKALTRFKYFQMREQWKITDFLFNPMVLMMILPLLLMLVLPKMMSDPEAKKEMENLNLSKMTNEMPEMSEFITSFFTGGQQKQDKQKAATKSQAKRRNNN
ncbi:ER membrane protein complex subunit 7 homolog [Phlebotomus argentipes]|uniref:ER membrane protein complex subunit 7 homolog n=1 Tax=Phlebotomus argentipes TaxID=94469 RepID=UPI00289341CC|nr:ER membrane protein complex subunit 7 homolog [Phlebotomus argentipes]